MRTTILPTWAPSSMRALASASRAKSTTRSIRGSMRPAANSGSDLGDEARHRGRALRLAAQLVGDAEQRQALRMQGVEVDLGVHHAVDVADRREPALEGEGANVLGEHRAADRVDDQVGAALRRSPPGPRARSRAARVRSATSRPRGASAASLSADPEVPMTLRAERLAELQRRDADARRHAVDEQPFAGLQPALQHQHVEGDEEGERNARGLLPRQVGGHRHRLGRLHQRVLRERRRAAAHDAIAGPKAGDVGADGDDLARAFAADRLPAAGLAVQAVAEQELAAVERSGVQAHEQLAGAGRRHRGCRAARASCPSRSSASTRTASSASLVVCRKATRHRWPRRSLRGGCSMPGAMRAVPVRSVTDAAGHSVFVPSWRARALPRCLSMCV